MPAFVPATHFKPTLKTESPRTYLKLRNDKVVAGSHTEGTTRKARILSTRKF